MARTLQPRAWDGLGGVLGRSVRNKILSPRHPARRSPPALLSRHPLTRRPLLPAPGRCRGGRVPEPAAEGSVPADQLNPGDDEHRGS